MITARGLMTGIKSFYSESLPDSTNSRNTSRGSKHYLISGSFGHVVICDVSGSILGPATIRDDRGRDGDDDCRLRKAVVSQHDRNRRGRPGGKRLKTTYNGKLSMGLIVGLPRRLQGLKPFTIV